MPRNPELSTRICNGIHTEQHEERTMPTAETSRSKKRKTRRKAVLQFRIPEAEYRELAKTAAKHDLTISEEAARRLLAYPMMAQEVDVSGRFINQTLLVDAAEDELERRGYRKFVFRLGPSELGVAILTSSQLEELLVKATKMGAELALKHLQR
jgi:hypothetical protein